MFFLFLVDHLRRIDAQLLVVVLELRVVLSIGTLVFTGHVLILLVAWQIEFARLKPLELTLVKVINLIILLLDAINFLLKLFIRRVHRELVVFPCLSAHLLLPKLLLIHEALAFEVSLLVLPAVLSNLSLLEVTFPLSVLN